jgi:hypothetical protein
MTKPVEQEDFVPRNGHENFKFYMGKDIQHPYKAIGKLGVLYTGQPEIHCCS